jgi:phosphoribosylamine-glycine ligase
VNAAETWLGPTGARFEAPTDRYGHAIMGDLPEWGRLCLILVGGEVCVTLPQTRVFEDIAPRLAEAQVNWADDHAMTVVLAANGYPGSYEKGSVIGGLDGLDEGSSAMCFHAGTSEKDGNIIATGGRVLNVTARGATLQEARDRAYAMAARIDWPNGFYRKDIGWRAL